MATGAEAAESPATLAQQRWGLPHVRLCADQAQSQPSCSYHTFVRSQCWEEKGADGTPIRRCRRTLEKFRDCGRGREDLQAFTEEVVDTDRLGGHLELQDHEAPFRPAETPQRWHEPLDSRLGDAVEDIVKLAAELQPGCSGGQRYSGSEHVHHTHAEADSGSRWGPSRLLPYFFNKLHAQPRSDDLSPGRARAKQCWDEYKNEFREV